MTRPLVFKRGDQPPGPDVAALMDHRGGVWPRIDADHFNCPGNEPHTWDEMSSASPAFVACDALPDYEAAVAADAELRGNGRWKQQPPPETRLIHMARPHPGDPEVMRGGGDR